VAVAKPSTVERLTISSLEPRDRAVASDNFHSRFHIRRDVYSVRFIAKINHDFLDVSERSRLAKVIGEAKHSVVGSGANDERIRLCRITVQLKSGSVQENGRHHLAGLEILQTLTRRLAIGVLLHAVRIGTRYEPINRLYDEVRLNLPESPA
jgi:hypothetical protein